jgi:hypothetical protein
MRLLLYRIDVVRMLLDKSRLDRSKLICVNGIITSKKLLKALYRVLYTQLVLFIFPLSIRAVQIFGTLHAGYHLRLLQNRAASPLKIVLHPGRECLTHCVAPYLLGSAMHNVCIKRLEVVPSLVIYSTDGSNIVLSKTFNVTSWLATLQKHSLSSALLC